MITRELEIREDLCISCGGCALACPKNCIEFIHSTDGRDIPKIDSDKCIGCKLCFKACPISECKTIENIKEVREETKNINYNYKENCYLGYSKDKDNRFNASTAGVATTLAKELLDKSIVECVLLVKGDNNGYEVYLATESKDVDKSRGSKYRPINLLGSDFKLKEELKKFTNIMIIGLPCHINAIYNISKSNSIFKSKRLLTVAIFCKQNKDLRFSEYIRKLAKIREDKVSIKYRGEGWPGKISFHTGKVNNKSLQFNNTKVSALFATRAYSLNGCFMCADSLGNIADISLGDAWNKEIMDKDRLGSEYIICNTEEGRERLLKCEGLYLEKAEFQKILEAQGKSAIDKKYRLSNEFYDYYTKDIKTSEVMRSIKIKNIFENSIVETILRKSPDILVKIFFRFVLRG